MEKHVYFVRHGESEENATRVHIGATAELTETGRDQARLVAERVKRIGVDAIITSPFVRAHDTAAAIAEATGVPHEANALLGEWLEPSHVVGLQWEHPERQSALEAIRAAADDHHYRHSDEETFAELLERARAVVAMIEEHPAERICVVTHGGFLRVIVGAMIFGSHFTKREFVQLLHHISTTNTGITYAKHDDPALGWRLVTWNDQSHLG